MSLEIGSSTMGAAIGLKQAQGQVAFGVKALGMAADQQQQSITALLSPGTGAATGSGAGGNVIETRGQNLNIVV